MTVAHVEGRLPSLPPDASEPTYLLTPSTAYSPSPHRRQQDWPPTRPYYQRYGPGSYVREREGGPPNSPRTGSRASGGGSIAGSRGRNPYAETVTDFSEGTR